MAFYDLENFESFATQRIRPTHTRCKVENAWTGEIETQFVFWPDLEPEYGVFDFSSIDAIISSKKTPCKVTKLVISPVSAKGELPKFAAKLDDDSCAKYYSSLIRHIGARFDECPALFAVEAIFAFGHEMHLRTRNTIALAYAAAFRSTFIAVDLADTEMFKFLRARTDKLAIQMNICSDGRSDREAFEEYSIAYADLEAFDLYKKAPVFLSLYGKATEFVNAEAIRYHVSAYEGEGLDALAEKAGPHIELRRLICPETVTSGGAFPLRFWFDNTGTAPIYVPSTAVLGLVGKKSECEIKLDVDPSSWVRGDFMYYAIPELPELPEGEYEIYFSVRCGCGCPIKLGFEGDRDGKYFIGKIKVDSIPRPEHYTAFDKVDLDGYYPVTDPAKPAGY